MPTTKSKTASSTSLARAEGFNRERVKELFYLFERIAEDNNLGATINYKVDKTCLTNFQKKPIRVASMKCRSKICPNSTRERGVNTTAVC